MSGISEVPLIANDYEGTVQQYCLAQIRHFLDGEGRLKSYPAKHKMQIFTLFYLASKFELGKNYTEKEVNQILNNWHTFEDWAMLRRDLFDKRFLWRDPKGKEYRLEDCQPTLSSFGCE